MADFATEIFLNTPVPTVTICCCKRLIAINPAAAKFLQRPDLAQGCTKYVCGTNCLTSFNVEDLNVTIEGQDRTWDDILEKSRRGTEQMAGFTTSFSHTETYVSFKKYHELARTSKPPHDSPIDDAFPPDVVSDFRLDAEVLAETVTARLTIGPFVHNEYQHYILTFSDIFTTQHEVDRELQSDQKRKEDWMSRCQLSVFDSVPLLGYLSDADGNFIYLNKLARIMNCGVYCKSLPRQTELLPLWTADFSRRLNYDELPAVVIQQTRKELKPTQWGQINPKTMEKLVIRGWGNALFDEKNGEFLGAVVFAEVLGSLEELKEKAKMERLRSFETICDTMPHCVWTADAKGSGEWFSSQWLEYTGLTAEECTAFGWKTVIHPDDLAQFEECLRMAHEKAIKYEVETRCRGSSGTYRWFMKRGAPIKNNDGQTMLWTGTDTDIHDSVIARQTARHQRDQMISALQHAQVDIWALTKDRRLTMIEGRYREEFADYTQLSSGNGMQLESKISSVMSGEMAATETEIKSGDRWYKVIIIPDVAQDGTEGTQQGTITGVIGCSIDITDEKMRNLLERDNKQLSEEKQVAKEQSRMKSKFLANMSHEIRTPVAGVIGLTNLLLDSDLDEEQRDHAEAVQMSAQTLLMIVNDILDFSKVESGKLTLETIDFNLATLVSNLYRVMQYSAAQKSIDFSFTLSFPDDLTFSGDPGRIRQILTNLLSNAIKFTKEGHVRMNVGIVPGKTSVRVVFEVEDSGIGIKTDVLSNLFVPFQQGDSSTARKFGGSGLGLSISRSLASLMKGNIELQSIAESGTTATFSVPLVVTSSMSSLQPPSVSRHLSSNGKYRLRQPSVVNIDKSRLAAEPLRRPSLVNRRTKSCNDHRRPSLLTEESMARQPLKLQMPLLERSKAHILLVEDNAVNRLIAMRAIEKLGFTVSAVWNGKEALDYLTAESDATHRPVDLLLMDCQMPVMDGYRATSELRRHDAYAAVRDLPVIAMTASAIQGDREKCFDAGMSDYLAKPVEAGALEAMLVKWLCSGGHQDGRLPELNFGYEQWT